MRLRTVLIVSVLALALLGFGATIALAVATAYLRQGAEGLVRAVEMVRATEELEVALLMHDRECRLYEVTSDSRHAQAMKEAEAAAHGWLAVARGFATDDRARQRVNAVASETDAYFLAAAHLPLASAPERMRRLSAALTSTDRLVAANFLQAQGARAEAQRLNALTDWLAPGLALLIAGGTLAVWRLVRSRVYRPLVTLRDALAAFRRGGREARVAHAGTLELQEIAGEFNEMAKALTRRDQGQLEFLAGVAHDLRNPVNVLKLSVDLLQQQPSLRSDPAMPGMLGRITRQLDRLSRMVEDLLDRTRLEAGNLALRLEACDLVDLISEHLQLNPLPSQTHRLQLLVPERPVLVRCDPMRLAQVFDNLLNNAVKYSPDGGSIRVAVDQEGGSALVSISDQGLGIPSEDWDAVFEPFQRSTSTSGEIAGVGLGLSVARRIMRAHHGDIELDSVVGKGSTFRVRLPVLKGLDAPPNDPPVPAMA